MSEKFEIFLDTNILIDYFENRNLKISSFIQELLENKNVIISTSFYNLIELLDKLQEIKHIGKLILDRKSTYDEIIRSKKIKDLTIDERNSLINKINEFIQKHKIEVYVLNDESHNLALQLMANVNIDSQDSLIVSTFQTSKSDVFITNDKNLIKSINDLIPNCFLLNKEIEELKKKIRNL